MSQPPRDPSVDFPPTASWPRLRLRAELLKRLRAFFDDCGFLEVETPLLSTEVVIERHLEPMSVRWQDHKTTSSEVTDGAECQNSAAQAWLQCSPEAHMKRLLAAGAPPIYQVTHSFRAAERGRLHNPEFTLVEWYRPGDSMSEGIQLLSDLCETLLARGPAERMSYREAFMRHAKLDPFTADVTSMSQTASAHGLEAPDDLGADPDGWLDFLRARIVEPNLGIERPLILTDWPASQAALACVKAVGARDVEITAHGSEVAGGADSSSRAPRHAVAERFELYLDGIELANGYHELTDADELSLRQQETARQRRADGRRALPEPSRLLAAMRHGLPGCAGVALGFDRVVMLASGARSIEDVMAFPFERA